MKYDAIVGILGVATIAFALLFLWTENTTCLVVGLLSAMLALGFAAE